ncbi:MAG: DNA polymerase III subunit delta [Myxococcota bacterium]
MAPRRPTKAKIDPFAALEKEGPGPVYAVDGVQVLVDDFVRAVRAAVFPPGAAGVDFNLDQLTGPETSWARVLDTAQTLPAFAPRRLVLVHQANLLLEPKGRGERSKEEADKAVDALTTYLEAPSETTTLVLVAKDKWDGRLRAFKAFKKAGVLVRFDAPKEREMAGLLRERAKALGAKLEPDAARALVAAVGTDLGTAFQNLEQLWLYVGPNSGQPITRADVEAVVSDVREENVFQLMDAIAAGHRGEALAGLHNIFAQGRERKDAIAFRTFGLLARQFRNLLAASAALAAGARPGDLPKLLGVPPFAADKLVDLARQGDPGRFSRALVSIAATDRAFKGGTLDYPRALERLVLALQQDAPLVPPETRASRDPRA